MAVPGEPRRGLVRIGSTDDPIGLAVAVFNDVVYHATLYQIVPTGEPSTITGGKSPQTAPKTGGIYIQFATSLIGRGRRRRNPALARSSLPSELRRATGGPTRGGRNTYLAAACRAEIRDQRSVGDETDGPTISNTTYRPGTAFPEMTMWSSGVVSDANHLHARNPAVLTRPRLSQPPRGITTAIPVTSRSSSSDKRDTSSHRHHRCQFGKYDSSIIIYHPGIYRNGDVETRPRRCRQRG